MYSRLAFIEKTISKSPKVPRTKFIGSDEIFCFISICKFGCFKNSSETITSLSELYFRFRIFFLFVQTKKVTSMKYGSSTSGWKPWRWGLYYDVYSHEDVYSEPWHIQGQRHILTLVYSEPKAYSEPWYIQNTCIFRTLTCSEPEAYSEPLSTQNPVRYAQ